MRLVVAITGASGVVYGVRLLEELKKLGVETYVVVSDAAYLTIKYETSYTRRYVSGLSAHVYGEKELEAPSPAARSRRTGWSSPHAA